MAIACSATNDMKLNITVRHFCLLFKLTDDQVTGFPENSL
jgi:hypothetical protein